MNRRRSIKNSEINNYLLVTNCREETGEGEDPPSGMYLLKETRFTRVEKERMRDMKCDEEY